MTGRGLAFAALVVWFIGTRPDPQPTMPPYQPIGAFGDDIVVRLPTTAHDAISGLLRSGRATAGPVSFDFGRVQTVTIEDGVATLSPPATIKYNGPGLLNLGTTITKISAHPTQDAIHVDIDYSPIDVKVISK